MSDISIPTRGVKIFFEPKAKVPEWVLKQSVGGKVMSGRFYGGRTVLFLRFYRGNVSVSLDGEVSVMRPGVNEFQKAFSPKQVLEIHSFFGKLVVKRSHNLCTECGTLGGKIENYDFYEDTLVSFTTAKFKCTRCGNPYMVKM